jgi:hypothetical protein
MSLKPRECVIYGIKYDKKKRTLVCTFFCAEPRILLVDIPFKEAQLKVRNEKFDLQDVGIVWKDLYAIIEEHLL